MAVTRINEFRAQEGQREQLRDRLRSLIPTIQSARGCRSCELLEDQADAARLLVIEVWDSVEAHRAALQSVAADVFADTMQLLAAPPIGRYYGSGSDGATAADRPVLNQLNIVARDFAATLDFYRRLGVNVPDGFASPEGIRHAEVTLSNGFVLEFDNLALARVYNAAWRTPAGSGRALIGFSLPTREAVDQRYAALIAAGYEGRQAPYDTFWGARYAVVADPNGNDVGIMSPLDDSRRSWPPTKSPPADRRSVSNVHARPGAPTHRRAR